MKIILVLISFFSSFSCAAQTTKSYNKLFGGGKIDLVSDNVTRSSLNFSLDEALDFLQKQVFRSGKILVACNESETPKTFRASNSQAIKRALKKCDSGATLALVNCVTKDENGKSSKPFNQMILVL